MLVKLLHWLWTEPMRLSLRHALPLGAAARRCLRPVDCLGEHRVAFPHCGILFPRGQQRRVAAPRTHLSRGAALLKVSAHAGTLRSLWRLLDAGKAFKFV